MSDLQKGMKVSIIESGEKIDEAIVLSVGEGGNPPTKEIKIKSLKLHPGDTDKFALFGTGWRLLYRDPMGGGLCFSERGPAYKIEPAT